MWQIRRQVRFTSRVERSAVVSARVRKATGRERQDFKKKKKEEGCLKNAHTHPTSMLELFWQPICAPLHCRSLINCHFSASLPGMSKLIASPLIRAVY